MKYLQCLCLGALLTLTGCLSSGGQPALSVRVPSGVNQVRVVRIVDSDPYADRSGSAVPIGNDLMISCLHVFPPSRTVLQIDGQEVPISMQYSGRSETEIPEDWCIFSVPPGMGDLAPNTCVDFSRPVEPGETVYLAGFFDDGQEKQELGVPKTLLRATVVEVPQRWKGDGERIIYLKGLPRLDAYHGLSGGAAMIFDQESQQWVIVGVYRGTRYVKHDFWGLIVLRTHTVVRPPVR